jgi:hypothetical protein
MLKLPQPLPLPIILIQPTLSPINMVRTIISRTILSIVAAARAIRIWGVPIGRRVRSQRVGTRIRVVHVEGEVICLGGGESDGVVDAEELVEEAGAFAALDVAAAAAGVVVGVERHWDVEEIGL